MISVIIPVYNVEKYIERCVKSVLNQTYQDFEILLINDGSTDNSGKICEELAFKHEQIRLIEQKNQGVSAARNIGIEKAKGEFLTFIDSDDFIDKNYLKILFDSLIKNNADISCCEYQRIGDVEIKKIKYRNKFYIFDKVDIIKLYLGKELTGPWGKLYRKKVFSKIYFPIGKRHEDIATIFKVILNAKKLVYTNDELYFYYKNVSSFTKQKFNKRNFDLIDAWNEVYILSRKYPVEIQKLAEFRLNKAYFTLLGIIVYYGFDKSIDLKEQDNIQSELLHKFKEYFSFRKIISTKYLSLNRKIAMCLFKFNYGLCKLMGCFFRNI